MSVAVVQEIQGVQESGQERRTGQSGTGMNPATVERPHKNLIDSHPRGAE